MFHGSATRRPDRRRALIDLSPGGSDASVTREFDLVDKRFVPADEGGFVRPVAKGSLTWIDDDTVYVTSDFGPGSLTRSGYPRSVRRWRRGTPIEDAEIVFEGDESDVAVGVSVSRIPGFEHHVFERAPEFFTTRTSILRDGLPVQFEVPDDAEVGVHERWIFVSPRSEFAHGSDVFASGSLLVADLDGFLAGSGGADVVVHAPTTTSALAGFTCTRNLVVLNVMDDVRNSIRVATPPSEPDGKWGIEALAGAPDVWTLSVSAVDSVDSDDVWLSGGDFLTPDTLFTMSLTDGESPELLRQAPSQIRRRRHEHRAALREQRRRDAHPILRRRSGRRNRRNGRVPTDTAVGLRRFRGAATRGLLGRDRPIVDGRRRRLRAREHPRRR